VKSRIKPQHKISNKQKADIREYCANEMRKQQKEHTRRMIKIFCVVLHKEFKFGAERCLKALAKIEELSYQRDNDEVFWTHIDKTLEQTGLTFPPEDYEEMDR
jgi:hypothetical protein